MAAAGDPAPARCQTPRGENDPTRRPPPGTSQARRRTPRHEARRSLQSQSPTVATSSNPTIAHNQKPAGRDGSELSGEPGGGQ